MVEWNLIDAEESGALVIDVRSFGPERFSSRELSRLEFGARLLDLADDHMFVRSLIAASSSLSSPT